ncbi:MAG TPA: Gfo/Idh/MocA family oxidoreductase [Flavisolibacter sp.]|nr:Gfo/Idh/MocA family oxidoreductase [Flavisolibacter sp.]
MKPINTVLCSFGMSGWVFHAPFITTQKGFSLYGVLERTKNLAAAKYPGIKTFRSLEEVLNDKEVELVVVNTPNATHYDFAKKALLADKHVVVEKPFTVTVKEGEELIKIARDKNRILSVYQNRRFDSDFKTVRKVVEEKLLGDLVEVEIHYDRYKEELSPKMHKEGPGPGSGLLYDLGPHLIDQALQLFGWPQYIFADIEVMRPVAKVDDYFELLLYYNKMRVRLKASNVVREALPAYILHGLKGSFIKQKTDVQEEMLQAGEIPGKENWGIEPTTQNGFLHTNINGKIVKENIPSPAAGNYGEYYEQIYKAIRENGPVPVTAEDGLRNVQVIEKAMQSSKEKKVIAL